MTDHDCPPPATPRPEEQVTRVEVIDHFGRAYSRWDCAIELAYQDQGRTLKVFVTPHDPMAPNQALDDAITAELPKENQ